MKKMILAIIGTFLLSSCALFRPAPGKEKEAEAGFAASKPVIAALEKYRVEQNRYPSTLDQLVPKYLSNVSDLLGYEADTQSYSLGFTYGGWGISDCEYRPERDWNCKAKY